MRVLLLSAYDTPSHRYWRESLVAQFPEYRWTVLTLAPRYFNFRVRTNPISLIASHRETLQARYDLLIATSLVDVVTLRGLIPSLSQTPTWIYCHENQFAYPASASQSQRQSLQHNLDVKMVFLYALLSANAISFNSDWNRRSAFEGLRQLFTQFPEKLDRQLIEELESRSNVLPVPLLPERVCMTKREPFKEESIEIVWNHRWEYDKGPEYLLAFVKQLLVDERAVQDFRPVTLHVVGQQFRQRPAAFSEIESLLSGGSGSDVAVKLGEFGFIESAERYHELLDGCDVVLSTALHDFQGLAVMEAVQRGCVPLVPDALAYPEHYPKNFRYTWHEDPAVCAQSMIDVLQKFPELEKNNHFFMVAAFSWQTLRPVYQRLFEQLACGGNSN